MLIKPRIERDEMKKKYKISLVIISIMFFIVLGIGTGYGLWVATHKESDYNTITLDCFNAYFSNGDVIEMSNIDSVVNEEGKDTSPYTITVTNICDTQKELQVHLNILKESTVDTSALTLTAVGHINQPVTLYQSLPKTKTKSDNITTSKTIGIISVKPNETVRTNVKLWFDERKAPNIPADSILRAKFELVDTESTIKPAFSTILIPDKSAIVQKGNPLFNTISTTEEGLFATDNNGTKVYYYRGNVTNNYVSFANLLWRIVSISDNETIKLILDKPSTYQPFSINSNYKDYTGLKYIYNNELINANVNNILNTWYNDTIIAQGLDKYVVDSVYCNDSNHTLNYNNAYFEGNNRVSTSTPTLTCQDTMTDFGGRYTQKIGLITVDEVMMAGGLIATPNNSYYLYNGETFYTMTPAKFEYGVANLFAVNSDGQIFAQPTNSSLGIRPVINIPSTVTVTGSGTINEPYVIDIEEE